jgi:hypothetical protein
MPDLLPEWGNGTRLRYKYVKHWIDVTKGIYAQRGLSLNAYLFSYSFARSYD